MKPQQQRQQGQMLNELAGVFLLDDFADTSTPNQVDNNYMYVCYIVPILS